MVKQNKKFKRASIYSSSGQKRADKIAYQIIEILENLGVEVFVTESLSDIEVKKIILLSKIQIFLFQLVEMDLY